MIPRDHPELPREGKIRLEDAKSRLAQGYSSLDLKKLLKRGLQGVQLADYEVTLKKTLEECRIRTIPVRNIFIDEGLRRCWISCPLEWRITNRVAALSEKWMIWTKPELIRGT